MNFKNAFKRKAKRQSKQVTRARMHWRHKENGWEVVSSVLCDQWDNAVHPEEHDDFTTGTAGDTDVPRHSPDNAGDWETFLTEETHMPTILDKEAFRQFESAFRNDIDYLDAEEVADFLHDTFEAEYTFDTAKVNKCNTCNGTGSVCDADDCLTYCYNGCSNNKHEKLRVSDDACSCGSCNFDSHQVECPDCDGAGKTRRTGFTRTFPYERSKILSEMPSKRELQVLQFTLNKMAAAADENDTVPSFRSVMQLFDAVENGDTEDLMERAVSYIEPSLSTVEAPKTGENGVVTDDNGEPVMEERPDPSEVKDMKVKFTAMLNDIPKQQAEQQVA